MYSPLELDMHEPRVIFVRWVLLYTHPLAYDSLILVFLERDNISMLDAFHWD